MYFPLTTVGKTTKFCLSLEGAIGKGLLKDEKSLASSLLEY